MASAKTARAKAVSFETVREIGRTLAGTVEGTTYGSPALKVGGEMFACIAINRSAEPDTLAVRVNDSARDALIDADPDIFYVTDHYVDYAIVLVRLGRIHRDALEALLREAHRSAATRKTSTRKRNTRTRKPTARTPTAARKR
jgi:hypothetical protein